MLVLYFEVRTFVRERLHGKQDEERKELSGRKVPIVLTYGDFPGVISYSGFPVSIS